MLFKGTGPFEAFGCGVAIAVAVDAVDGADTSAALALDTGTVGAWSGAARLGAAGLGLALVPAGSAAAVVVLGATTTAAAGALRRSR